MIKSPKLAAIGGTIAVVARAVWHVPAIQHMALRVVVVTAVRVGLTVTGAQLFAAGLQAAVDAL